MTDTVTIAQEQLVATPEDKVLYMSRRANLRLVKDQIQPKYGPGGRVVGVEPGQTVVFQDGTLRVPREGAMTLEDGRSIEAAELTEWLEGHRWFNDQADGFWRVDPTAPPISQEEQDTLLEIVLELDEERLVRFIEQERSGWNRDQVLVSAEKALERIRALRAEAQDGKK